MYNSRRYANVFRERERETNTLIIYERELRAEVQRGNIVATYSSYAMELSHAAIRPTAILMDERMDGHPLRWETAEGGKRSDFRVRNIPLQREIRDISRAKYIVYENSEE